MKSRSHRFTRENEYTETIVYDEETNILDAGYQKLRILPENYLVNFTLVTTLFLDYNELTYLPESNKLPNLVRISCISNEISEIPFYPRLKEMNVSKNRISRLDDRYYQTLRYLDISHNKFKLNNILLKCKELYINNNDLNSLNLDLLPNIVFLDCSNNNISNLKYTHINKYLLEIDASNNKLSSLPIFPNITIMNLDYNNLENLITYPKLELLNINHNNLSYISNQPCLKTLNAKRNKINSLGIMPSLRNVDLTYNEIRKFIYTQHIETLLIYSNPLKELELSHVINTIKELAISYELYENIYSKYKGQYGYIEINVNPEKVKDKLEQLKKFPKIYSNDIIEYIGKKFNNSVFGNHYDTIVKIAIKMYRRTYMRDVRLVSEVIKTMSFRHIVQQILTLYYSTLVVYIYFNNYYKK